MKFFHLSDLHIGLRLYNRDMYEDQLHVFEQIIGAAERERPDAVVIAGDIYDRAVPAAEAVELFDRFISGLSAASPESEIMLISGNHDSASRVDVFRSILRRQKIHMIGTPPRRPDEHIEKVTLRDEHGDVDFWLLPFVRPSMVRAILCADESEASPSYDEALHRLLARETVDAARRNVLVSHQFYLPAGSPAESVERMDSETCTVGNIDAVKGDMLEAFDYAALGHIHKPMRVGGEFCRYCGAPLSCSVSEAGQRKGIIMVTLHEKGRAETELIPLSPLHEVRVVKGSLHEALEQSCEDYVSVVLTDEADEDFDMQDRLRRAFPNLLEIRRENRPMADYSARYPQQEAPDPFDLCCAFLGEPDGDERALLRDVINTAREASV